MFIESSFSLSVTFSRPRQHPTNEEHHSHRRAGRLCALPRDWLPLLLHQVVQKLCTAALQPPPEGLREQRHTEAVQRAAGGRWGVQLQGHGAAQQDGLPECPPPCER